MVGEGRRAHGGGFRTQRKDSGGFRKAVKMLSTILRGVVRTKCRNKRELQKLNQLLDKKGLA